MRLFSYKILCQIPCEIFATQCFFHWLLKTQNRKKNNFEKTLSKSLQTMCILLVEFSKCPDYIFKFSKFIWQSIFWSLLISSYFDFSTTFLQEQCKKNVFISFFIIEILKRLFITITLSQLTFIFVSQGF